VHAILCRYSRPQSVCECDDIVAYTALASKVRNMDKFIRVFGRAKDVVIGMVHVRALPGISSYTLFYWIQV